MAGEELGAGEVQETKQILGEIRRVARLAPIVQHAERHGAIAEKTGVRVGITQVDVGHVVLPADLAESLIDPARGHVAPTGLVEVIAGEEVIEVTRLSAGLSLKR